MTLTFADTFYFIALLSPDDQEHVRVTDFMRTFRGRLLTTAWVLTELADGLCKPLIRERVGLFIDRLHQEAAVQIVPCGEKIFRDGLQLFRQRSDKEWSLTDCISFIVMQQFGITEALTGDRHFEQAGFVALLK